VTRGQLPQRAGSLGLNGGGTTPKTKHNPEKVTQNAAKQNCIGLVASYDTQPGNEVGLLYNSRAHTGLRRPQRHSDNCNFTVM